VTGRLASSAASVVSSVASSVGAGALPGPAGQGAAPSYLSPTGADVLLVLLGVVAVAAALLVVTTRQLVHAALWLVVTLGAVAGSFLVMTAEFVAWVQVLVYVGAVVALLLFGLMLTRAPIGRSDDLDTRNKPVAAVAAVATAIALVALVVDAFRSAYADLHLAAASGGGSAEATGAALFRTWVLPFEVLSVLLLAALVGAIALSRRPPGVDDDGRPLPGGEGGPPARFGGPG
jgi:NADH-quinone oxidoreductase subunit J